MRSRVRNSPSPTSFSYLKQTRVKKCGSLGTGGPSWREERRERRERRAVSKVERSIQRKGMVQNKKIWLIGYCYLVMNVERNFAIGHEFRTSNIHTKKSLINKRSTVAGSNIKKKKKKLCLLRLTLNCYNTKTYFVRRCYLLLGL